MAARAMIGSLSVLAACVAFTLAPAAMAASKPAAPRAKITSQCKTGPAAAKRKIIADATMRPVKGTKKLAIEFWLQAKASGATTYVTLPTLGVWIGHKPISPWQLKQPVALLAPGDTYRFEVLFRWYGSGATVLKNETLYSKPCVQPTDKPQAKS